MSAIAPRAKGLRRYADASALVKLVLHEPESAQLREHVGTAPRLLSSRLAVVEVTRAAKVATSDPEAHREVSRLLSACDLVDVSSEVLREAARLAAEALRTLDAVHLASIVRVQPDEVLAYDRRLVQAARELGFTVAHPGIA